MEEFMMGMVTATIFIAVVFAIGALLGFVLYKFGLFADLKTESNSTRRLGRMLAIMIGLAMMVLGIGKLAGFQPQVERFDQYYHMLHMVTVVGITELVIGLLLLYRKTFKLAVLLLHVSLGGSMVVHFPEFSDGIGAAIGSVWVLGTLWLSVLFYAPEMFPEFMSKYNNSKY